MDLPSDFPICEYSIQHWHHSAGGQCLKAEYLDYTRECLRPGNGTVALPGRKMLKTKLGW